MSEKFLQDTKSLDLLWLGLRSLAADSSINVRYQLAFTLGDIKHADKLKVLAEIVRHDATNSWMRAAALSSLAEGTGEMFALLWQDGNFAGSKPGLDFLSELIAIVGAKNKPDEVASVGKLLADAANPQLIFPLFRAFGEGLRRSGGSGKNLVATFQPVFIRAAQVAVDQKMDELVRLQAIQLLGTTSYADSGKTLIGLLDQNQSQAVQIAAINSLAQLSDVNIAADLIQRFSSMTPRVRSEVLTVLLARPERVTLLLNAIEQGTLHSSDLTSPQIKFLKNHRDAGLKKRSATIFANVGTARREDVVANFQPALGLTGDAAHGKTIYLERCASCHRAEGSGFALGPDLVTVKNSGKEKLLVNILDPNREVAPNFKAFEVETKDEESLIGLVANETATSVTLLQAFGKENVILRSQIKKILSQEQSLMPEGLEAGLKPQDLADLLEYISK